MDHAPLRNPSPGAARRRPRRARPANLAATLAGVATLAAGGAGIPAVADTPGSGQRLTAAQEQGMKAGLAYRDPVDAAVDARSAGLIVTLNASGTQFDVGGEKVWGQAYTGSFVAPTIHLTPGRTMLVQLVNHLPVATNVARPN